MKNILFLLFLTLSPNLILAGPETGSGTGFNQLEGFEDFKLQSAKLQKAIASALSLVHQLGISNNEQIPELYFLSEEIEFSKYILVNQNVTVKPNRSPGDYPIGTFLVASTDLLRGAPTRIYPRLIPRLSETQIVQMILHEALHRTLPEPMNGSEAVVERITSIITQYSPKSVIENLIKYIDFVKTKKIPWIVNFSKRTNKYDLQGKTMAILKPLFDDQLITESYGENSRIRIHIWAGVINDDYVVEVSDVYRKITYSFDSRMTSEKSTAPGTAFIKSIIHRIEEELKL